MSRVEDCPSCVGRGRKILEAAEVVRAAGKVLPCFLCRSTGRVPLPPPVGEVVAWRRPLSSVELELVESGQETAESLDPCTSLRPLVVLYSCTTSSGSGPRVVEVEGWLLERPDPRAGYPPKLEDRQWVEGLGWVIPAPGARSPFRWLEKVKGPSRDPGCWRWKEDGRG